MKKILFLIVIFFGVVLSNSKSLSQWVQLSSPSVPGSISLHGKGSLIFMGYASDAKYGGGVYKSSDGGLHWSGVNSGQNLSFVTDITSIDNNLFVSTINGIFLSTNDGSSWSPINNGLTNRRVYCLGAVGTSIFAGTSGDFGDPGDGIFMSSDNGQNWNAVNNGLPKVGILHLYPIGSSIYCGTEGSGVFYSSNNGSKWVEINNGLSHKYIDAIAGDESNIFVIASQGGSGLSRILFATTNNGATWTNTTSDSSPNSMLSLLVYNGSLFVGAFPGVYLSTNNGNSWRDINQGLESGLRTLIENNGTLYAGKGNDFWKRPLSEVLNSSSIANSDKVNQISVLCNYPNPCNAFTKFVLNLKTNGVYSYRICSQLGNCTDLINTHNFINGFHEINLVTKELHNGVHFLEISTEEGVTRTPFVVSH